MSDRSGLLQDYLPLVDLKCIVNYYGPSYTVICTWEDLGSNLFPDFVSSWCCTFPPDRRQNSTSDCHESAHSFQ